MSWEPYYDRKGQPITMEEWGRLWGDFSYRTVGKKDIGGVHVSTMWLGIDHNFEGGPPLIFETMIFGGAHDEFQERYSTEEQALEGHRRTVARLATGMGKTRKRRVRERKLLNGVHREGWPRTVIYRGMGKRYGRKKAVLAPKL